MRKILETRNFLSARLLRLYFRPREFEVSFYRKIGIPFLGMYIPTGGSRFTITSPFINQKLPRLARIQKFINTTILAESGHTALMLTMFKMDYEDRLFDPELFGLNLFVNIFPIILQRYNRARAIPVMGQLLSNGNIRRESKA